MSRIVEDVGLTEIGDILSSVTQCYGSCTDQCYEIVWSNVIAVMRVVVSNFQEKHAM